MTTLPIAPKVGEYVRNIGGAAYVAAVLSDALVTVKIAGLGEIGPCRVTRGSAQLPPPWNAEHCQLSAL